MIHFYKILFFFSFFKINLFYFLFYFIILIFIIKKEGLLKNNNFIIQIKIIFLSMFIILFFINIYLFIIYIIVLNEHFTIYYFSNDFILINCFFNCKLNYFFKNYLIFFSIDFFGFLLYLLIFIVVFISLITINIKLFFKKIFLIFIFMFFIIIFFFFISISNYFLIFFFYELFLIISFLFVYFSSYYKKAILASIYFLIWTQIGSLFLLIAIIILYLLINSFDLISLKLFTFTNFELNLILFLFFIGFGFKIPIWPFYYWLIKTHLESQNAFSIFLSGFLVKTALYGFYKLTNTFIINFNFNFFIIFFLFCIFDTSLKFWSQIDLKKIIVYSTIQEMNIIFLMFCWGDSNFVYLSFIYVFSHAIFSSLMFFIVECLYNRYLTRSIKEINGLLFNFFSLSIIIIFTIFIFVSIPGTIRFLSELFFFSNFLNISLLLCLWIFFITNFFGVIGFCKNWFNLLFGFKKKKIFSLTLFEQYIFSILFIFLFINIL